MSNKQRRRQGTGKTHILDQLRGTNAEGKHEWPNVPSSRQDCLRPHRCRCTVCAHLFWWLSRVPSQDSPCLSTHDLFERSFILPKYKPFLSIYSTFRTASYVQANIHVCWLGFPSSELSHHFGLFLQLRPEPRLHFSG